MLPNNNDDAKAIPKTRAEFRFIIDADGDFCCPMCGDANLHIATVIVDQGHTRTQCKHDGATVTPSDRHERHRGSEVDIGFWCEGGGHAFTYTWSFHKGITSVALDAIELPRDEDGCPMLPCELWRD